MSTYGAVANITCDNGFSLTGLAKKECGSNGVWSVGANATCTKKGLCVKMVLTHISLASFLWDIGKQNSPRCDAAKRGAPSGLFCLLL